ncbi:Putative GTP diphosphokinase RSH1 chloroplastic [Zea mays]|uniref:GTP diphosphokinase n=1 Tax=Zea mays TaxID=4577 RepID=A0A1D6K2I1_MAIZE|nr:Putative GTP diphosphokinase RSH1 chloroplastic [Zea mays]ONL97897.1 Putative GTP diphosphokinase RSH1 chloroplastic [Zea mays]ONL97898.1 Putative GTP diphosphokinase RSH1 chloroplastic [Zea mays]
MRLRRAMQTSPPTVSASSLECVSSCRAASWKGGGRPYECSVLLCAWNAPRALTGALASTAQCSSCGHAEAGGGWRRRGRSRRSNNSVRFHCSVVVSVIQAIHANLPRITLDEDINRGKFGYDPSRAYSTSFVRSWSTIVDRTWRSYCYSSSDSFISPETLWEDLKPAVSYLQPEELKFVHDALKLAYEAHSGQKRRSGEPFIIHPVEVARILGEHELDWESIAAGLLHDTVEDTNVVTFERIENEFGPTVRRIVEGETKVSKLGKLQCKSEGSTKQDIKAEDLRQMFLAMTEEVRVIIVKLADRLHNMRTLTHMPQHKQYAIAVETLQVFAPLAKLLGMYRIKSELEYLSFMYVNPTGFAELRKRVEDLYKSHEQELEEANRILRQKIAEDEFLDLVSVETEVRSVYKELYSCLLICLPVVYLVDYLLVEPSFSIYKTTLKSKSSINEVNQVAQLRIIIKPKSCNGVGPLCTAQQICYHVLGLVHGIWTPIPQAVEDYIATPKPNGYQSLHTTVIPFLNESMFHLEVQIRTEDMDLIAERGIAAHYSGRRVASGPVGLGISSGRNAKGKVICLNNTDFALRIGWLNAIREWQEEFVGNMSSREFVDTITRDLLGSRVFVFTPKGEKLSSKYAFQRHQQWLQHAKTRSARHKIMRFLREQAALSAAEITADAVNSFVADLEDESDSELSLPSTKKEDSKFNWEKILSSDKLFFVNKSSDGFLPVNNVYPKVNGKQNKTVKDLGIKINGHSTIRGDSFSELMHPSNSTCKEVFPGLDDWKSGKISGWHNTEGNSVQWLCIACVDRKGMMAEVTSALTACGITVCSCVAEVSKRRGMGAMLFHFEGSYENVVSACLSVDMIFGVLGWSVGCSWCPLGALEC